MSVTDAPLQRARPNAWFSVVRLALLARPLIALNGFFWIVSGKRVRGWNLLCLAAANHSAAYANWIKVAEPRLLRASGTGPSASFSSKIAVLIIGNATPAAANTTINSLQLAFGEDIVIWSEDIVHADARQLPACDSDLAHALREIARDASAQWLLPIRSGDRVSPALGGILERASKDQNSAIFYWDEDTLSNTASGIIRTDPWIKSDWDSLLFSARDGLSGACVLSLEALSAVELRCAAADGIAEALVARIIALAWRFGDNPPAHIPLILTHRAGGKSFIPQDAFQRLITLQAVVLPTLGREALPTVSIIIPTRDRADLLEACLAGLAKLNYQADVDIIIIDNGSVEQRTRRLFAALEKTSRMRVIPSPGAYNFSALINAGAQAARGTLLCLLNNDVVALDGDWLAEMARYASLSTVGAVGACLLFPDGTIQHAGVALGIGDATGHICKGARREQGTQNLWLDVTRHVSAVTAACLVIERSKFEEVDGLDATNFAVDFNDVDFCLRLNERGWANVYCAQATLIHHESRSRGNRRNAAELAQFQAELAALRARWHTDAVQDPYHSPLFRRAAQQCLLAF